MKRQNATRAWVWASMVLGSAAPLLAADDGIKLEPPATPEKNRFGLSYRAGFNVTAQFKNVGNFNRPGNGRDPGPATGSGVDRFYDDGYNRVDISGNGLGLTSFWGYKNASQVPGNDTVVMHSTSAAPVNSKTIDSDPEHGFELTYNRELGRFGKQQLYSWGLEGGFGWTDVEIRDTRTLYGGTKTIADAFGLEGIDPHVGPMSAEFPGHAGSYFAFNEPLIEDNPTRTITSDPTGARITGQRNFDADLFSIRLGPYVDVPLDKKWTLSFSAGVAVGVIDGEFHYDQNVRTIGGIQAQRATGGNTDVLWGGYLSASIRYAIDEHWGVFVTGQYLGLAGTYKAEAAGQRAELDLARTALVSLGVSYSF